MTQKTKEKVDHLINILKENNLKELHICNFGTYKQYELAGEFISVYPLDDCELDEELYEKIEPKFNFINENFIKKLGLYESGQNELWLTENGFESRPFTI